MSEYVILTDSTSDLPFEIINKFNIDTIPFKCTIDNNTFDDKIDKDRNEKLNDFYKKIENGSLPYTSQPNPSEFNDFFEKYLCDGKDILFISFSSGLSGGYNSSLIAANELKEKYKDRKINIVDSKCASLGEGLLVYEAALLKRKGMSLDDLTSWVENNKLKIMHIGLFCDLSHLKRGGRVSSSAAFLGSILNIILIFKVNEDGKLEITDKKRGLKNTINFLVEKIEKEITGDNLFIVYSNGIEGKLLDFEKMIKNKINVNILVNKLGHVIGSHTGRNTLAAFYMKK